MTKRTYRRTLKEKTKQLVKEKTPENCLFSGAYDGSGGET